MPVGSSVRIRYSTRGRPNSCVIAHARDGERAPRVLQRRDAERLRERDARRVDLRRLRDLMERRDEAALDVVVGAGRLRDRAVAVLSRSRCRSVKIEAAVPSGRSRPVVSTMATRLSTDMSLPYTSTLRLRFSTVMWIGEPNASR
jgi:hypothetical protein